MLFQLLLCDRVPDLISVAPFISLVKIEWPQFMRVFPSRLRAGVLTAPALPVRRFERWELLVIFCMRVRLNCDVEFSPVGGALSHIQRLIERILRAWIAKTVVMADTLLFHHRLIFTQKMCPTDFLGRVQTIDGLRLVVFDVSNFFGDEN